MAQQRKLKLQLYLKTAWILKIRLISARRQLWDPLTSLIHIENASLQLRKCCEVIARLCLIAAEVEGKEIKFDYKKEYKIGRLFKELDKEEVLRFPNAARLLQRESYEENSVWSLEVGSYEKADIERVGKIHAQLGNILHDNALLNHVEHVSVTELNHLLNLLRGDHQWLWNRFWHHAIQFHGKLFFVSLGDMTQTSNPIFIKEQGLVDEDLKLNFNPELIADFSAKLTGPNLIRPCTTTSSRRRLTRLRISAPGAGRKISRDG